MNGFIKKFKAITSKSMVAATVALTLAMLPTSAHAAEFGLAKVLKNIMAQLQVGTEAIIIAAFAIGTMFVLLSALLIREAGDPKQAGQNKGMWMGILSLWVGAGIMFYIGVAGTLFGESLFGEEAKKASSINETDFGL